MNYYILGKLPDEVINEFKQEILKNKESNLNYSWIHVDDVVENLFLSLFKSLPLKIQYNHETNRKVQKAFFSNPGYGFRIHKDGKKCKSALNIAISANETDWVRWYSDETINKFENINNINFKKNWGYSRDTNLKEYEDVPYDDELRITTGIVYILNVDKFHSWKCNGPNPRIILQTKFEGYPDLNELYEKLKPSIFKNIY